MEETVTPYAPTVGLSPRGTAAGGEVTLGYGSSPQRSHPRCTADRAIWLFLPRTLAWK